MVISEASFATEVPSPIDSPTWAALSAGASLVPSPVTATTSPHCCRASTRRFLSIGRARAIIFISSTLSRSSSWVSAANSGPVMILRSVSVRSSHSPVCLPISLAVPGVSPVTIFTFIPASSTSCTASGTSSLTGSDIAVMPRNVSGAVTFPSVMPVSLAGSSLHANPRVRMA